MNILERIDALARREHDATVDLIEALLDCDRLRAHVDAGYSSLFDLLVRRLRASNAAAARRLAAVRCAQRAPRVLELLRARRTSLTVLAKIESTLASCDDVDALLDAIDGRSQTEVEAILAARRPVALPRERVRTIAVTTAPARESARTPPPAPTLVPTRSAAEAIATEKAVPEPTPRVALSFSLESSDFADLERARFELGKNRRGRLSLEDTLKALVASYLTRNSPKMPRAATSPSRRTRHVPVATRRAVLARDGHRGTYVAPDGTRCGATRGLELDHVVPFALGGSHDASNLRVLCRAHNQRAAEREFGPRRA